VRRELVQNEYRAGGTELVIDLDQEKLVVSGNGRTIDKAGWKRLSALISSLGHDQRPSDERRALGRSVSGSRSAMPADASACSRPSVMVSATAMAQSRTQDFSGMVSALRLAALLGAGSHRQPSGSP
jgi:hypothetical protein